MSKDLESTKGELSKAFKDETAQTNWQDRGLRSYSDDDLERWRDALTEARDKPGSSQDLTIGGSAEKHQREITASEREAQIRRIDAELMHRLMKARELDGHDLAGERDR